MATFEQLTSCIRRRKRNDLRCRAQATAVGPFVDIVGAVDMQQLWAIGEVIHVLFRTCFRRTSRLFVEHMVQGLTAYGELHTPESIERRPCSKG